MNQLFLVRHGQTVHNAAGLTQGWNDSDLSEQGRDQVKRLAERLVAHEPTALYSSTLGRARATAEAIANETGLEIIELEDLREMCYGDWEGRSFLDIRKDDEANYRAWMADETNACPGGESHADVRRRLERAFEAINSERPVVVSHGTAIRVAATALLNVPVMASRHFAQDNAALNIFVRRSDHWVLKVWNDVTHCG